MTAPQRPDLYSDIVSAARTGDARAMRVLILRTRASRRKIVGRVLGHEHPDAEDVVQEAEIALLASLQIFRGESSILHYANNVALRVALAARRRLQFRQRWLVTTSPFELPLMTTTETPLSLTVDKWSQDVIVRLLRELPLAAAQVLRLRVMGGYTTAEIAEICELSESTVRSQLRAAKQEFRRLMRRELRTGRLP
ncbi:MAG TPA: RNA polymerase sigma factor [Polyangiaceae bacterium]|nr:RNA polymerase sigma factor [Polyangiaceae bacterium]